MRTLKLLTAILLASVLAQSKGQAFLCELDDDVFENEALRLTLSPKALGDGVDVLVEDKVHSTSAHGHGECQFLYARDGDEEEAGEERAIGWYDMETPGCTYSFDLPVPRGGPLLLSRNCSDPEVADKIELWPVKTADTAVPVVAAQQLGSGRFHDWGERPAEDPDDGPLVSWVHGSLMCEGPGESKASSTLAPQGARNYKAGNVADDDPTTAWVEGKEDHGIGEYLELSMDPYSSGLYLLNGHQGSTAAWENNSRVKKLRVSINGRDACIVELKDCMGAQRFDLPPSAVDLYATQGGGTVMRFTIMEVYPGLKWKDTAISEIWTCGG